MCALLHHTHALSVCCSLSSLTQGLKINNVFSIELVFKAFDISVQEVKPTDLLRHLLRERLQNQDWSVDALPQVGVLVCVVMRAARCSFLPTQMQQTFSNADTETEMQHIQTYKNTQIIHSTQLTHMLRNQSQETPQTPTRPTAPLHAPSVAGTPPTQTGPYARTPLASQVCMCVLLLRGTAAVC